MSVPFSDVPRTLLQVDSIASTASSLPPRRTDFQKELARGQLQRKERDQWADYETSTLKLLENVEVTPRPVRVSRVLRACFCDLCSD